MAGIFKNGVWSMGFDMDPSAASIFTFSAVGSATTSLVPFGTGYSWSTANAPGITLGTNLATLIVGFRYYVPSLFSGIGPICFFYDATANAYQCGLHAFSDGHLQFFSSNGTSTAIGSPSATGILQPATWVYIELKVTISTSAGLVECRINGNSTPVISNSSVNTQTSANAWVSVFQFQNENGTVNIDDWYMLDTTASSPLNTYLGNVQVKGDKPNNNSAVGGRNAFTATNPTNVNYTNVGNIPFSSTEYNFSDTVGQYDMFRFPTLSASTVFFLNEWVVAELDSAGSRTIELDCYSSGTDATGTAFTPAAGSPTLYNQPFTQDPNTSTTWTVAGAQAAELGMKVVS